jgi:hypothetical protein
MSTTRGGPDEGAEFTSRLDEIRAALVKGEEAGLIAGATVLINAVKRGLRGGFTSGQFTTGALLNSVTRSEPMLEDKVRVIRVGTNLNNPPYPLFWELGHHNIFTRRYERKEVWRPALMDNVDSVSAAFARAFRAALEQSPTQRDR